MIKRHGIDDDVPCVVNYDDIRESLELVLGAEVSKKKKQKILDSLDDAIGNNFEYLKLEKCRKRRK